jgi:cyclic pyranopterin phosphate synthase
VAKSRPGETANRYAFDDGGGEIGLINSITQPFCGNCSRARITADGMLHSCLFSDRGMALKPLLRGRTGSARLVQAIRDRWSRREDSYSELRDTSTGPSGREEMYRMGG